MELWGVVGKKEKSTTWHILRIYCVGNSHPVPKLISFALPGPGRGCPSSHVQRFEGNRVSIAAHGRPAHTHEERLGHPPNQCPRELTRPIPTGACPGKMQRTHARAHTHPHTAHDFKENAFWLDMTTSELPVAPSSHMLDHRHQNCAFHKTLRIYHTLLKVRILFLLHYCLSFLSGGSRYQCNLVLFRGRDISKVFTSAVFPRLPFEILYSFYHGSRTHSAPFILPPFPGHGRVWVADRG